MSPILVIVGLMIIISVVVAIWINSKDDPSF